jgi:hypothetical protein
MEKLDEKIVNDLKQTSLNENKMPSSKISNNKTKCFKALNGAQRNSNYQRYQNKHSKTVINGPSNNSSDSSTHQHIQVKNKKTKRLPWNTKVLEGFILVLF